MSIFDKLKRQSAAVRLTEEIMYEVVVDELQNGIRRNGLWAKALAKSQGDEAKANALYITYRVQSLKDESEIAEAFNEQEAEESRRRHWEQKLVDQQERDREANRIAEEPIKTLNKKGFVVIKIDSGWLIIEPFGVKRKISTAEELHECALSIDNYRKT